MPQLDKIKVNEGKSILLPLKKAKELDISENDKQLLNEAEKYLKDKRII